MKKQTLLGCALIMLSAVIFGLNPLLVLSIQGEGINSISLVLLRNMLSIPVLAALAYLRQGTLRIPAKALPAVALTGVTGCCITPILLFSSYSFIASGTATVFHFAYPAVVVLLGALFFRERVSRRALLSVAVCAAGVCLFYTPGEPLNLTGSALALVSGVAYAVYILQLSRFPYKQINGFLFSLYVSLTSCAVMLAVCLATGLLTLPATLSGWLGCFGFSLAINVGAVVMFQQGTFYIGGQKAAILSTLEPITSLIVGALVFGEAMSLQTAAGCALVILASILIAKGE